VIAESAAARDADIVRLYRHADDLHARVAELETPAGRSSSIGSPVRSRGQTPSVEPVVPTTARRPWRRPHSRLRIALTAALVLLLVLVALPEALGDRPYDPRPSRVEHL
jgi:hypothetical protein